MRLHAGREASRCVKRVVLVNTWPHRFIQKANPVVMIISANDERSRPRTYAHLRDLHSFILVHCKACARSPQPIGTVLTVGNPIEAQIQTCNCFSFHRFACGVRWINNFLGSELLWGRQNIKSLLDYFPSLLVNRNQEHKLYM